MSEVRTSVAIIVFNRPDLTRILLDALATQRIRTLYVVMDGPRVGNTKDAAARTEILQMIEAIDFAQEVHINASETNMGCGRRVKSGLDWVFDQTEEAIILEDDCIPSPSFFRYCDELLEWFKDDRRIGIISGTNLVSTQVRGADCRFSRYANVWGWATWRRTWDAYDWEMAAWKNPEFRRNFRERCANTNEYSLWNAVFTQTAAGLIDTWDYQLWLSIWKEGQLSIVPDVNLIDNLGFQHPNATHTGTAHPAGHVKAGRMEFPLKLQTEFLPDAELDEALRRLLYRFPSLFERAKNRGFRELQKLAARQRRAFRT